MSVNPGSSSALLGNTIAFAAQVSNTTDTAVTWSVNGTPGGSAQYGTITSGGVYTAPAVLPANTSVQVTATSQADATKSASAKVTLTSDVTVSITPAAGNVELGAAHAFQAAITSQGHPQSGVTWSLAGAACPAACGSVDANGNYTAPQILPSPATITLIAASVADASRGGSATIEITSSFTLQLSAPSNVMPGASASLVATLTPAPGSNPNAQLNWSLQGTGCTGTSCGMLTIETIQAAGGGQSVAATASYTAPQVPPAPNQVQVTVTSVADPSRSAKVSITLPPAAALQLSPSSATRAVNHRITLTAASTGGSTGALTWSVNGIAGGNSSLGQICVLGSIPCQPWNSGTATQVDYLAPGALPSPDPVTIGVSQAGSASAAATAQISIINHLSVSVLPGSASLPPLGVQAFTAQVLGADNQNVTWQVQGSGCSVAGACGVITSTGAYTAPPIPPSPNSLQVVAISQDDPSQTATANVNVQTGANILTLFPSSVYATSADGFTLRVEGSGFVASSGGSGSALIIDGMQRITTCASANSCSAPVNAADVAQADSVSIQVQNPDGTSSNVVQLIVVAPSATADSISLTPGTPAVTGKDIVVVQPTSAGVDSAQSNVDLQVAAMGAYQTTTNSCLLAGNPIALARPSSGTSAAEVCLFSMAGLDTTMSYRVSGSGDVAVIAKQPAGLGIIHLTLQIPSTAAPGLRTIYIQNTNLDMTAATGALEIQ